jgi:hypothetical protein
VVEPEEDFSTEFGVILGLVELLAWLLPPEEPLEVSLSRIARLAVEFVPACDTCGVSLLDPGGITTRSATGPVPVLMDEYQYFTDEGPCIAAIRGDALIRVPDLDAEDRWPTFAPMAQEAGVASILAIPFPHADGQVRGALNLYSGRQPFRAIDERATGLAVLAAVAVNRRDNSSRMEHLVDNLLHALQSREVIGEAKGIIMERHQVTAEQAFELLREASLRQSVGICELAEALVTTRILG